MPQRSSISRLQALDKSHSVITERLEEAAVIAGINLSVSSVSQSKQRQFNHSRAEWVLRWLADKVKFKDVEESKSFRLCSSTWELFHLLIQAVPQSNAARILNASNILQSVQFALDDWVVANRANKLDAHVNGSTSGTASKKRKRSPEDAEPRPNHELQRIEALVAAIERFLKLLIDQSHVSTGAISHVEAEHMMSVLRCDSTTAAKFLCAYLMTALRTMQTGMKPSISLLESVLYIWRMRKTDVTDDMGHSASHFSNECLVPACLLIGRLSRLSAHRKSTDNSTTLIIIEEVKNLLYEHSLLPARLSFDQYRNQKDSSESLIIQKLVDLLKPLQEATAYLFTLQDQEEVLDMLNAIPSLYQMAAKHSRHLTMARQSQDLPWLQALLEHLATIAGEDMTNDTEQHVAMREASQSIRDKSALESMLRFAHSRKISIKPDILERCLNRHSGLMRRPDPAKSSLIVVRWSLVQIVLDLDGDLFITVDDQHMHSSRKPSKKFTEELLLHISSIRLHSESLEPEESRYDQLLHSFVSDIVIKLMHTYGRSRELPRFFQRWQRELAMAVTVTAADQLQFSPWTAPELIKCAGAAIQSALNPTQIVDILDHQLMPAIMVMAAQFGIEVAVRPTLQKQQLPMNEDPIACFYTAIVYLEAILGGVSHEATIQAIERPLVPIWTILQEIMVFDLDDFPLGARIWRVLSLILHLQSNMSPTRDQNATDFGLHASILNVAKTHAAKRSSAIDSHSYDLPCSAYCFILALSDSVRPEGVLENTVQETSILYFDSYITEGDQSIQVDAKVKIKNTTSDLAVLTRYPFVFQSFTEEHLRSFFYNFLTTIGLHNHDDSIAITSLPSGTNKSLHALNDELIALSDPRIISCLIQAETSILKSHSKNQISFILDMLIILPVEFIRRQDRDALTRVLLQDSAFSNVDNLVKGFSILHKFVQSGQSSWDFFASPTLLMKAASLAEHLPSMDSYQALGQLARATFEQVASTHDVEYFINFDKIIIKTLKKSNASSLLSQVSLLTLLATRLAVPMAKSGANLRVSKETRAILLKLFSESIQQLQNSDEIKSSLQRFACLQVQHILQSLSMQSRNSDEGSAQVTECQKLQAQMLDNTTDYTTTVKNQNGTKPSKDETILRLLAQVPFNAENINEEIFNKHTIEAAGCHCKTELILQLIDQLEQVRDATLRGTDFNRVKSLLLSQFESGIANDTDRTLSKRILPQLAQLLQGADSLAEVGYTLSDIHLVLRSKPFLISQYGIDALLGALIRVVSPGSHYFLRSHASQTYMKVCLITNAIILLHRKHIHGRMPILLALLQVLQNSLFIRHKLSSPNKSQRAPSWLPNRGQTLESPHATAYARILLTLTQPTVSSTSARSQSSMSSSLTDETRKAKQHVAAFAPYILAHFCSLHLVGSLSPDVRKAVLPGIWACIEAVPHEARRGMNASMTRDERAIWASLWADWSRSQSRA